jgi:hypothetical protein
VATEAARPHGNNFEKEEIKKKKEKKRKRLTLTGLLMEGTVPIRRQGFCNSLCVKSIWIAI